ncbi:MAG: translation initiation factor IF-2, partial [Methanosarcinaceae archaeon]
HSVIIRSLVEHNQMPGRNEGGVELFEALVNELQKENISIRKADIGDISHHDIIEVSTIEDPLNSVIIGFNVGILPDAKDLMQTSGIKLFMSDVIYKLVDTYTDWVKEHKTKSEKSISEMIIKAGQFRILPDCTFRQSKPAVVGVKISSGMVKTNVDITSGEGIIVGRIKGLQANGENIGEARIGMEVAMAIEGPTVGRQIKEGDILYVNIPERHAKILEHELYDSLKADEIESLEAFLAIKRRDNPFWAK